MAFSWISFCWRYSVECYFLKCHSVEYPSVECRGTNFQPQLNATNLTTFRLNANWIWFFTNEAATAAIAAIAAVAAVAVIAAVAAVAAAIAAAAVVVEEISISVSNFKVFQTLNPWNTFFLVLIPKWNFLSIFLRRNKKFCKIFIQIYHFWWLLQNNLVHALFYNLQAITERLTLCREYLQKGNDQYSWPPCTN